MVSPREDHLPPWRLSDLVMAVLGIVALIAVYAVAGAFDERADAELERLAAAERARIATQQKLPPKVREAYADDRLADERRCHTRRDGREYCLRGAGDPR